MCFVLCTYNIYMQRWDKLYRDIRPEEIKALKVGWDWFLGDEYEPFAISLFGDCFLRRDGAVFHLDTGIAELTQIAGTMDELALHMNDAATRDTVLLAPLAAVLKEQLGTPSDTQCYSYAVYPIFSEGSYEPENFYMLSCVEHLGVSGDTHRQIASLPDGASVQMRTRE